MNIENNKRLLSLASVWHIDGDLMECRQCKRQLVASRDGEPMRHKDGCRHADQRDPWLELRNALGQ